MGAVEKIITDNLSLWSASVQHKSTQGRGSSSKRDLYGVKKLRELILDLAVRGLLVPQDPNDEPASVLLAKAYAEKQQLIKDGKISKQRRPNSADKLTAPFKLPNGWTLSSLADIGHDWGQKKPDKKFTYIDVGAINKELGFIEGYNILDKSEAPSRARKIVRQGTVIYSTVRPYLLNIAVIDRDFTPEPIASTAFAIIHPFNGINSSYLYSYLRSPIFVTYVENCQTGIAYPAINDRHFFSGVIALPPAAEQHRIVTKVDELMALCDTLEQQQENSIETHETLVETLLDALTNAPDAKTFQSAWQRLSANFDTLLTTEHSVDKLKETILQLAVMGTLVPQDPNDEPASKLLESIAHEKAELNKNTKKKQKTLDPVDDADRYFLLPQNWAWARLGEIIDFTNGFAFKSADFVESGIGIVKIGDIQGGTISSENMSRVPPDITMHLDSSLKVKKGDMVIAMSGATTGKLGFNKSDEIFYLNQRVGKIDVLLCHKNYIYLPMTTKIEENLSQSRGMAIPNLSTKQINDIVLAVPPLAEQHRIVAKVDELMALCDDLKQQLNEAQTTQMRLTDAVVENAF